MPFTAPGPLSSVLQEISSPNLASGAEVTPVPGLSGRADITTYAVSPHLPSLIKEVVVLGANAVLDANVEVTGNLQVDGVLSANSTGTQSTPALNISPGPLVVAGATGAFGGLVSVVQEQTPISNPGVGLTVQSSTDYALGAEVSGDTSYRFAITGAGGLNWGSGSGTIDTRLSRTGVSALTLTAGISSNAPQFTVVSSVTTSNPLFQAQNFAAGDLAYGAQISSDTTNRWVMSASGKQFWGAGGTATVDTNLYRSGAGTLATDFTLSVGGSVLGQAHSWKSLFGARAGVQAETFPRICGQTASGSMTSQTVYLMQMEMPAGLTLGTLSLCTKSTALTGSLSHGWYVLTDQNLIIRGITADQTGGAWLSQTNTLYPLAMSGTFTTAYEGLYYVGAMVATAGGTGTPNLAVFGTPASGLVSASPVVCGTSSTSQTTPPSTGSTLSALSANANFTLWADAQ